MMMKMMSEGPLHKAPYFSGELKRPFGADYFLALLRFCHCVDYLLMPQRSHHLHLQSSYSEFRTGETFITDREFKKEQS